MDKFRVIGPASILKERRVETGALLNTIIKPGEVVEIDDDDPRKPLWLEDGSIVREGTVPEETPEATEDTPRRRGRPPKE